MNFTMQRQKSTFQRPDLSISKGAEDKAYHLIENFNNGIIRQVKSNSSEFSTFKTLARRFNKDTSPDPSDKIIFDSIKRMEKDKVQAQVALAMSQIAERRAQNIQSSSLVKMIPYFIGIAGLITMLVLSLFFSGDLSFSNPVITRNLIISTIFTGLLIWGVIQRKSFKYDILAASILHQVCSSYAAAKMQGKGAVGALQNLEEMRTRSKSMQEKEKAKKKNK